MRFGSQFGGNVVNGASEVTLARMGGSWLHCICSPEVESNNVVLSSPFLFLLSRVPAVKPSACS